MRKLLDEMIYDLEFIRTHSLQPRWYQEFKVILLLGVVAVLFSILGIRKTLLVISTFLGLSLIVHMIYRVKTE